MEIGISDFPFVLQQVKNLNSDRKYLLMGILDIIIPSMI